MGMVIKTKVVTVTTAGTVVPVLGASDAQSDIVGCVIQAMTGTIYVGDATVKAATPVGHKLASATNDSLKLGEANVNSLDLALVYLDSAGDGQKANVTYYIRK